MIIGGRSSRAYHRTTSSFLRDAETRETNNHGFSATEKPISHGGPPFTVRTLALTAYAAPGRGDRGSIDVILSVLTPVHSSQPAFCVGPHVAGAFLKPRAHIYFARRAGSAIGRICPIRSARRLSSDALITGRSRREFRSAAPSRRPLSVEIIIYGIGVAGQGRGRLIPERAQKTGCRQKCIGGRGAPIHRVSRDAPRSISQPILSAGTFSAESDAAPLMPLHAV